MKRLVTWLKRHSGRAMLLAAVLSAGCVAPDFVEKQGGEWATIQGRKDVTYDRAWDSVVGLVSRTFDIALMQRREGYLRTNWLYTWAGKYQESYRVRLTVKLHRGDPGDGSTIGDDLQCEIKSEAEWLRYGRWVEGYDTRLLETMKNDIMGLIGPYPR